jgi:hypothetical protein
MIGGTQGFVMWAELPNGRFVMANCVQLGRGFNCATSTRDCSVQLSRNTFVCLYHLLVFFFDPAGDAVNGNEPINPLPIEASANIFALSGGRIFSFVQRQPHLSKALPAAKAEALAASRFAWMGQQDLYSADAHFLGTTVRTAAGFIGQEPVNAPKSLAEWKQFWNSAETGSLQESARFQGGDLLARLNLAPEQITPNDFRLLPTSPGYRAGSDGNDLGADIDLVGPGPAYERWKKTPEYQQWLKDTGQMK